jgi:hypothetical protein
VILVPWYAALCAAQGALVAAPSGGRRGGRRHALLGLAAPAAAMVVGVGVIRLLGSGADLLTWLGTIGTPIAAAAVGWAARWRLAAVPVAVAAVMYVVAWQGSGRAAEVAGVVLIGAACLAIAALVAAVAPARQLALGLVILVALDTYLVWGNRQVEPVTVALQHVHLPRLGVAHHSHPLPSLQQVTLGNSTMGWLDFLAPALLGALLGRRLRWRLGAAAVMAAAAFAWGLLLLVTSPIPATVPVLAALAVTWPVWWPRPAP